MRYGKLNMGKLDYKSEIAALKDLYSKGEIDKAYYNKEIAKYQRASLSYLIATNGGYTPAKKSMNNIPRLSDLKDASMAKRLLENREQILQGLEEAYSSEAEEKDTPSENNEA